jgi:hypothetical protein
VTPRVRNGVVLGGLAAAFFVAFLIEPEWHLAEAHRLCEGRRAEVFDSMEACTIGQPPGCPCIRPGSPWAFVFWIVALSLLGLVGGIVLRMRLLAGATALGVALAVAATCALFVLERGVPRGYEPWANLMFVVVVYIPLIIVVFGITNAFRHRRLS